MRNNDLQATPRRQRGRTPKRGLIIALLVLAVLGLALLGGPYLAGQLFKRWLQVRGAQQVEIAQVDMDWVGGQLRFRDLRISPDGGSAIRVGQLLVDFRWLALLRRQLVIPRLAVTDATARLTHGPRGWRSGGLAVLGRWHEGAWPARIGTVAVRNTQLTMTATDWQLPLEIHNATVEALGKEPPDHPLSIDAQGKLAQAPWNFSGRLSPGSNQTSIQGDLRMEALSIGAKVLPPQIRPTDSFAAELGINAAFDGRIAASGELAGSWRGRTILTNAQATGSRGTAFLQRLVWQGKVDVAATPDHGVERLGGTGRASGTGLDVTTPNTPALQIMLADWSWEGPVSFSGQDAREDMTDASGLLTGNGLEIHHRKSALKILGVSKIRLDDLRLNSERLDIGSIEWSHCWLGKSGNGGSRVWGGEPFLRTPETLFENVTVAPTGVDIGHLSIWDTTVLMRRDQAGEWHVIDELWTVARGVLPKQWHLNDAEVMGSSGVRIIDRSVTPPYRTTLQLRGARLEDLGTDSPDRAGRVALSASIGEFGQLNLDARMQSLTSTAQGEVTGRVEGIALQPLNPYAQHYLGLETSDGYLDADIQINSDSQMLAGVVGIDAKRLQLSVADTERSNPLREALALPLATTLTLLRDRRNRIHFDLSVEHDWKDGPLTTSLNHALGKALNRTALDYVQRTLEPHGGLVLQGKTAMATPQLKAIPFPLGKSELTQQARAYLDRIGRLLRERPQLTITLCITETPREPTSSRGAPATTPPSDSNLAGSRRQAIRRYLVDEQDISSGRLAFCQPSRSTTN